MEVNSTLSESNLSSSDLSTLIRGLDDIGFNFLLACLSGLPFMTPSVSLCPSNSEIRDVAGARDVVSVNSSSPADAVDPLRRSTGSRSGDRRNTPTPLSAPEEAVPGLALRLAASVAAIKLALFASVANAAELGRAPGGSRRWCWLLLLPCSGVVDGLRKRALRSRSLSFSAASSA